MDRLTHQAILDSFAALDAELQSRGIECELVVMGGAALVLRHGARDATKDVDAVVLPDRIKGDVFSVATAFQGENCERSTRSRTYGSPIVKVVDLVEALLNHDALAARQWVADAERTGFDWSKVEAPDTSELTKAALTAGVVELLAARANQLPPPWTRDIPSAPEPVFLVEAARTMRRLRAMCEEEGPEPLRKRHFLAPPDFLEVA